jgi:hypothetical protein
MQSRFLVVSDRTIGSYLSLHGWTSVMSAITYGNCTGLRGVFREKNIHADRLKRAIQRELQSGNGKCAQEGALCCFWLNWIT